MITLTTWRLVLWLAAAGAAGATIAVIACRLIAQRIIDRAIRRRRMETVRR